MKLRISIESEYSICYKPFIEIESEFIPGLNDRVWLNAKNKKELEDLLAESKPNKNEGFIYDGKVDIEDYQFVVIRGFDMDSNCVVLVLNDKARR